MLKKDVKISVLTTALKLQDISFKYRFEIKKI